MHAIPQPAPVLPDWQALSEQRLQFSMALSTVLLATILVAIRFSLPAPVPVLRELVVELVTVRPRPEPVVEMPEPVTRTGEATATSPGIQEPPGETSEEATSPAAVSRDWETLRDESIGSVLDDAVREESYALNPRLEESRTEARERFRASRAPERREIWDNVEKDYLGRTILRSGDCYRVLDDPSVTNRWAFETFGQFMVYCSGSSDAADLSWVDDIRQRYDYLHRDQ